MKVSRTLLYCDISLLALSFVFMGLTVKWSKYTSNMLCVYSLLILCSTIFIAYSNRDFYFANPPIRKRRARGVLVKKLHSRA